MPAPALVVDALRAARSPRATPVKCATQRSSTRASAAAPSRPGVRSSRKPKQLVAQEIERRRSRARARPSSASAARVLRLEQAADVAEAAGLRVGLDRGRVGGEHLAALGAHALAAEQQLAGAAEPRRLRCRRGCERTIACARSSTKAGAMSTAAPAEEIGIARLERRDARARGRGSAGSAASSRARRRPRPPPARRRSTRSRGLAARRACRRALGRPASSGGRSSSRSR